MGRGQRFSLAGLPTRPETRRQGSFRPSALELQPVDAFTASGLGRGDAAAHSATMTVTLGQALLAVDERVRGGPVGPCCSGAVSIDPMECCAWWSVPRPSPAVWGSEAPERLALTAGGGRGKA